MRVLKVYGIGTYLRKAFGESLHVRIAIAAHSMAEAARLSGIPYHEYKKFGCETGNIDEVNAAVSRPGVPFWRAANDFTGKFQAGHVDKASGRFIPDSE